MVGADLSLAQARRIALAAQGLSTPRPTGRVDRRHVRALVARLGAIQIDSVNVLVRSQELPLFARLGPHRRSAVEDLASRGEIFEYWGHEASLLPIDLFGALRWRMDAALRGEAWGGLVRFAREHPEYVEAVYEEVAERGPLAASELEDPGAASGPWWGWRHGKRALEYLFWCGRVSARRRPSFERVYDLTERVVPASARSSPALEPADAQKVLLLRAARAHGVGTAGDLADYYRLNRPRARPLLDELVEDGALRPVRVEGWRDPAYLHPEARLARTASARALLSPFDSLVWERDRTERLFGFRYRLEIYTPAPKRVHGYYVLPFLVGDALVARVDLKADRAARALRVQAAYAEPGQDKASVSDALAGELETMAQWLELSEVEIVGRGDLAPALRRALRSRHPRGHPPRR